MNDWAHRWSNNHPLPVHVPDGPFDRFMLLSPVRPPAVKSSAGVTVEVDRDKDGWSLEFRLNSPRFLPAFQSLYEDMYNSTWETSIQDAAYVFVEIYNRWRKAFSTKNNPLSSIEIQGIIGEMVTLRDILIERLGPMKALNSWMISKFGKQDFITEDSWFEVKTTMAWSNSVKISSIEQLDEPKPGYLVVVKLKKTSVEDPDKVTVNMLIDQLYVRLSEYGCGEVFLRYLDDYGLPSTLYDDDCYRLCGHVVYNVDRTFPCMRRNDIPEAIEKAEYCLDLKAIDSFRVV